MLPIILAIFILFFIVERVRPGWELPKVKGWWRRVLMINGFQIGVVLLAGITWEAWFQSGNPVVNLPIENPLGEGLVAYFIATFVFYWWHRFRHESDFLWKHFHQIHHSPQRLETITSFYKHPLEMIVNSIIGSILVYAVLGISIEGALVYTFCTAFGEFIYHINVRSPRWMGFIFQRPEMHRIHHEYGQHKYNYGDIVWWDMLFGTYQNPKEFTKTCGFDEAQELRLKDMLIFKNVHQES